MSANKSAGFSIIEVMIALGVIGMSLTFLTSLCTKQRESAMQQSAKLHSQKEASQLIATIKSDYRVQLPNGMQVLPNGLGLRINRIGVGQNDPGINYNVTYTSVCSKFSDTQKSFDSVYTEAFRTDAYAVANSCLNRLKCGAGEYPSVVISAVGSQKATYAPALYPVLQGSVQKSHVGMALCVEKQLDQFKVWTESITLQGSMGAFRPLVFNQQLSIPIQSASDVVVLPN